MIVTKQQRRQSQSNHQSGQNHNYTYSLFQQDKENHFKSNNQSKTRIIDKQTPYYNRQRNSTYESVSKASTKSNNYFTPYQLSHKKVQKKYDYSVVFGQQQQKEKQAHLHQTHSKNNRFSHEMRNSNNNEKPQLSFTNDDDRNERRRCSSLKNSIPKYKYTENNYMLIQQKQNQAIPRTTVKSTTSYQKKERDANNKSYVHQESGYVTACNLLAARPSRYECDQSIANKENRTSNNTRAFFASDNFTYDNKFIQSKTHQKLTTSNTNTSTSTNNPPPTDPKSTSKYDQKYSRVRSSNRRSQVINKSYQYLQNQQQKIIQQQKYQNKEAVAVIDSHMKPLVDFQQLYKNSQTDNKKLVEKINRITQLNGEINRRLQKMLLANNLH